MLKRFHIRAGLEKQLRDASDDSGLVAADQHGEMSGHINKEPRREQRGIAEWD